MKNPNLMRKRGEGGKGGREEKGGDVTCFASEHKYAWMGGNLVCSRLGAVDPVSVLRNR